MSIVSPSLETGRAVGVVGGVVEGAGICGGTAMGHGGVVWLHQCLLVMGVALETQNRSPRDSMPRSSQWENPSTAAPWPPQIRLGQSLHRRSYRWRQSFYPKVPSQRSLPPDPGAAAEPCRAMLPPTGTQTRLWWGSAALWTDGIELLENGAPMWPSLLAQDGGAQCCHSPLTFDEWNHNLAKTACQRHRWPYYGSRQRFFAQMSSFFKRCPNHCMSTDAEHNHVLNGSIWPWPRLTACERQ